METTQIAPKLSMEQAYQYAVSLFETGSSAYEVQKALMAQGFEEHTAFEITSMMDTSVADARRVKAKKDMLYGGLWCAGGLILTLAHVGFIFWGAIVFGGIQFFKGVINLNE